MLAFYITARPLIYLSAASPMMKLYVYIIPAEKCSICNVKIIPIRSTLLLIFLDHKINKQKCGRDGNEERKMCNG
jgi:hypothetical protein